MAHKKTLMATAALALCAGLSLATSASACGGDGISEAAAKACNDRLVAAEEADRVARYTDVERQRRAEVEAALAASEAEWKREARASIIAENEALLAASRQPWARGVDINNRLVRNVDGKVDAMWLHIRYQAAPWLFDPNYPGPGEWFDDPADGGTGTGGDGTGGGTDDGTDGGGTDTGGGTGGGGTTDPDPETPIDPETDPETPPDTGEGDGPDLRDTRVALPPFPAESAVWRCSNFRVLTAEEDEALEDAEGEVLFLANGLRLRGQDGVERRLSVQVAVDENENIIIIWPFNQADLDEACPA